MTNRVLPAIMSKRPRLPNATSGTILILGEEVLLPLPLLPPGLIIVGTGVGVGVAVGTAVGIAVGVSLGVGDGIGEGVGDGATVAVGDGIGEGVGGSSGVGVGVCLNFAASMDRPF